MLGGRKIFYGLSAALLDGYEIKVKFHYAIYVADLVSDLAFDKFVRVCDQLATFFGSKAGRRSTGFSYLDMSR